MALLDDVQLDGVHDDTLLADALDGPFDLGGIPGEFYVHPPGLFPHVRPADVRIHFREGAVDLAEDRLLDFVLRKPEMKAEVRHRHAPCSHPPAMAGTMDTSSDRKSTRLNSSHSSISYAVFCLKKKKKKKKSKERQITTTI